ncbi:MAG: DNA repair protein RecN [Alphaproteobacteria bacterium]|nr:DNA repair protein RecN [Alphaproteobacteria bacterium]
MLVQLAICDIVLIEKATIPFASGLCVLSGETGAGKSILLDSLGLAIGNRAESRLVRAGKDQGVVTAEFDITDNEALQAILVDFGIVVEDATLIIRRILTADGKSRCFLNDQPISVTMLRSIGEMLVEIHGQHDQRGLLDPSSHRRQLDDFAGLQKERKSTEQAHSVWQEHAAALSQLQAELAKAQAEEEYLRHVEGELAAVNPSEGEEAQLAETRQKMMHGEKRIAAIQSALDELQGSTSVASSLHAAVRMLTRSAALEASATDSVMDTLERAALEVDAAVSELERIAYESQFNPRELEQAEERLFALRGLARKHNVAVDDLRELLEKNRAKLALLENQTTNMTALEKQVSEARNAYAAIAKDLSHKRMAASQVLEKAVMEELDGLKMGGTVVQVAIEPLTEDHWGAEGIDRVAFLASTNPGSPAAPLHKIASGGELSRFMLALKVAMRNVRSTPTVIFDEIDTGTGGAVADAIGRRLARLGEVAQVLVVTHLPQVAARGSHHLHVSKAATDNVTRTQVVALDTKARTEELARMLAGEAITDEARAAANKLMAG